MTEEFQVAVFPLLYAQLTPRESRGSFTPPHPPSRVLHNLTLQRSEVSFIYPAIFLTPAQA